MAWRPAAPVLYLLLLISVVCCTHLSPPAPHPYPSQCPPNHVLLDAVHMPAPPVLKAIAKIKVESPEETFSVKELIVAQKPNRLRMETLSPLGQPGFYVATDGQELFLFNPSENTYYHGDATPRNLGLIIPVKLTVEEMVSIIMGCVPLIEYDGDHPRCTVHGDGYALQFTGNNGRTTQVLNISRDELRVVASERYEGGELRSVITYHDYTPTANTDFPGGISISLPSERITVRISYKKVEFLPEIDTALFRLRAPQGARIIPLE